MAPFRACPLYQPCCVWPTPPVIVFGSVVAHPRHAIHACRGARVRDVVFPLFSHLLLGRAASFVSRQAGPKQKRAIPQRDSPLNTAAVISLLLSRPRRVLFGKAKAVAYLKSSELTTNPIS